MLLLLDHTYYFQTLASTSATPGHTKAFHFYTINAPVATASAAATTASQQQHQASPSLRKPQFKGKLSTGREGRPFTSTKQHSLSNAEPPSTSSLSAAPPLPTFCFVDVPGLGYADTATVSSGQQASWRSLLQRYMTVRAPLKVVFHLVDARHDITSVDKEVRMNI